MWVWKCEHCGHGNATEGPTSDGAICAACGGVHRRVSSNTAGNLKEAVTQRVVR